MGELVPPMMAEKINEAMKDSEWLLVTVNGRFRRVRKVSIIDFGVEADGKVHLTLSSGKDLIIEEDESYVKTMLGVNF